MSKARKETSAVDEIAFQIADTLRIHNMDQIDVPIGWLTQQVQAAYAQGVRDAAEKCREEAEKHAKLEAVATGTLSIAVHGERVKAAEWCRESALSLIEDGKLEETQG